MSSPDPIPKPPDTAQASSRFRRVCSNFYNSITTHWLSGGITLTFVIGLIIANICLYIDRANLTRARDDLRDTTARLTAHHDQSERDFAALRDNYHVLTSARASLEQSNTDANLRVAQFQQQNQTLLATNTTLLATKVGLENTTANATKQIQQLQLQNDSLAKANQELTAANADINQQLSQSTLRLQRLEKDNKDMNTSLTNPTPVPMAGFLTLGSSLSWGNGDIQLQGFTCHTPVFAFVESVDLSFKVGDDTKPTRVGRPFSGTLREPTTITGLRGTLTFSVTDVPTRISPTSYGMTLIEPVGIHFKATYMPRPASSAKSQ